MLADGDTIDGTEFRLEAIHTPGHAPNHLCFLLDEERALFTGDHVLNGTTTVVNPQRGGDMVQYLASLERLRKIKRVVADLPGPRRRDGGRRRPCSTSTSRTARRASARSCALLGQGPATIPTIVSTLYTETPEGLLEMARHQVHAHLLKLKAEGKVSGTGVKSTWTAS